MALDRGPGASEQGEAAIVQAASRILAAWIRNGRLTNGNHAVLIRTAVEMAVQLARETERLVDGTATASEPAGGDILDLLDE